MKLALATFGGIGDTGVYFNFTTGSLPAGITFTRASVATYFNNAGTLITASANVARFNYVSGVPCLLIEPAATNLLIQSNNFPSWSGSPGFSPVLTANQFTSPDGTNNGWSMTSGTGNAYIDDWPIAYSAIPYTMSIWSKQIAGSNWEQITIGSAAVSVVPTTTLTRRSATATPSAGTGSILFQVLAPSGETHGIFGAQLETGTTPTSYVPTTTAAVTRAADAAVFTIPAGVSQLTYTFDDNSQQTVSVSSGSYTIPTNLNRANIKRIGVGQRAFAM